MSSLENFDGLCGIIHLCATSDQQVRCKYKFGHDGPHSYEGTEYAGGQCFKIRGLFIHPVEKYTQNKK
jgi:hypothetical protein